jgi:hypothetical protein
MKTEEIIEVAIQGHASTRDAVRWAIQQEREECAKLCDDLSDKDGFEGCYADACAQAIRARGEK